MENLDNCVSHGIRWFHSFEMPDGESIKGYKSTEILRYEARAILPEDLTDKSVLDIGAWGGYFSFEAEKRGAADVLATDHFCWSGPGWGTKEGFDFIHARLGSKVRSFDVETMGLTPEKFGSFDIVLFLGVVYHVTDVYRHLEAAAAMCREHLVVETETTMISHPSPIARLIQSNELGSDPTNFWVPNPALIRLLLVRFGFSRIEIAIGGKPNRFSWLRRRGLLRTRRMVVHAWR